MEQYRILERLLIKLYRPHTFPVAVKLFKEEPEEFPEGTVFPHAFLDYPISFCQGFGIVRRYGWKVAFRREDNACPFYLFFRRHSLYHKGVQGKPPRGRGASCRPRRRR